MKTNKLKYLLNFFLVIFLLISTIISVHANEKPIVLTFAEYKTPNDLMGKNLLIFQEELEKATNGKVKIKIYWSESLLKSKEVLQGVEKGIADMGDVNPNYYSNQLPIGGVFNVLPRGPKEYLQQAEIYDRVMEEIPEWKKEYLAHNQTPLFAYAQDGKVISSTKTMASLDDFKNKKMRAASRWLMELMAGAGATPVSIPWTDCFMALQTGMIDAVLTNISSTHSAKLYEVAKNILLIPGLWSKPCYHHTINLDVWNRLSPEIQGQFMEAYEKTRVRYVEEWNKNEDAFLKAIKEEGCIVNTMSKEDTERWLNMPIVSELQNKWVKEMEEKGMENAQETLDKIKSIVEDVLSKS